MDIVPVQFVSEHKHMITRCKMISDRGSLSIHTKLEKLLVSLRTAVEEDGILDKQLTSYNDIFDAFRLALKYHRFTDL